MKIELLERFVNRMEELSKIYDNYVFTHAVSGAKELIEYGEYRIALEDLLDNICEESIMLDEETVNLARQAFCGTITSERERVLKSITKVHPY